MSNKVFDQPPLSIDAQIQLLRERNLVIDEEKKSRHYLQTIGYYRLMVYGQAFRIKPKDESEKNFIDNTTFSQILNLYIFDRELRVLIADALERIEIAFRIAVSNGMSLTYQDAQCYLNPELFIHFESHALFVEEVRKHIERSKEYFIKDYLETYISPKYPPIWMVMECLPFGTVSKLYANLKETRCRKIIARHFMQSHEILKSWIRSLSFTRNICAHHGYLWNRFFIRSPKSLENTAGLSFDKKSFVMQAYMIIQLLDVISPNHRWMINLKNLLEKHESHFFPERMGFPKDWQSSPLWKVQHRNKLKAVNEPQLLLV